MDKTALKTAAAKYGTPLYLFDLDAFTARAEKVRAAFGSHVQLCYSMKANPFVLRGLPDVFRWVEVCSPGELTICEKLGIAPERILYSGVNKGADDVARAVALGADLLTAESTLHFDLICAAAAAQGKHVRVLPRLTAGSQFGMDPAALEELVARRAEFRNVTIAGIHYFSGTQKRKGRRDRKGACASGRIPHDAARQVRLHGAARGIRSGAERRVPARRCRGARRRAARRGGGAYPRLRREVSADDRDGALFRRPLRHISHRRGRCQVQPRRELCRVRRRYASGEV